MAGHSGGGGREKPDKPVRNLRQKVNGGGKRIEARTESGKIVIQCLDNL